MTISSTVVPVMYGHPRDHGKVSVHCRWPLVTGTDGQAGDAKYNTPCNTTYYYQTSDIPNEYMRCHNCVYAIVVNLKLMQHNK